MRKRRLSLHLVCLAAVTLCWPLACDSDKPNEPDKPDNPPKDYVVYFADGNDGTPLYAYHTATGVIDSVVPPDTRIYDVTASADGSRLYVSRTGGTDIMDTETYQFIGQLPRGGIVDVSPDNRYLAIRSGWLSIDRADDYTQVFADTPAAVNGGFSVNGERYYGIQVVNDTDYMYRLDLADSFAVERRPAPPGGSIHQIIATPDESKMLMYRKIYNFDFYLEVYDWMLDSVVFWKYLTPGAGRIAIDEQSNQAFVSNPGTILAGPVSFNAFYVYAWEAGTWDSLILEYDCGYGSRVHICDELVFTPDNRILIGNSPTTSPMNVLVFDPIRMERITTLCLGNDQAPRHLTCQTKE